MPKKVPAWVKALGVLGGLGLLLHAADGSGSPNPNELAELMGGFVLFIPSLLSSLLS